METFYDIQQRAAKRKGSKAALASIVHKPLTTPQLMKISDDEWLEEFTRKVFQSGFYWSVIDKNGQDSVKSFGTLILKNC